VLTEREEAFGTDATKPLGKTLEHLRDDVTTLAEVMRARGWTTNGIYCNPYLGPNTGLARGFEHYTRYQYNAAAGTDLALEWLKDHRSERWFLFVHYIDPHYPYAPPDPYAAKFGGRPFGAVEDEVPKLDQLRKEHGRRGDAPAHDRSVRRRDRVRRRADRAAAREPRVERPRSTRRS
jgi:hypothetical protein